MACKNLKNLLMILVVPSMSLQRYRKLFALYLWTWMRWYGKVYSFIVNPLYVVVVKREREYIFHHFYERYYFFLDQTNLSHLSSSPEDESFLHFHLHLLKQEDKHHLGLIESILPTDCFLPSFPLSKHYVLMKYLLFCFFSTALPL